MKTAGSQSLPCGKALDQCLRRKVMRAELAEDPGGRGGASYLRWRTQSTGHATREGPRARRDTLNQKCPWGTQDS